MSGGDAEPNDGEAMQELGRWLTGAFDWMTKYNGVLALLIALLGMLATVVYAALTVRLVRETIRLRKVGTNPDIAIYFEPYERSINLINLVVKNIGNGPAYHLSFVIEQAPPVKDQIGKRLSEIALFDGFKYMAPGRELRYYFGSVFALMQEPVPGAVTITVSYESKERERQREAFTLDLGDFNGMVQLGMPPLHDIAKHVKHLESIAKTLAKMQRSQVGQAGQQHQAVAAQNDDDGNGAGRHSANGVGNTATGGILPASWWRAMRRMWGKGK